MFGGTGSALVLSFLLLLPVPCLTQLAKGKGKFLGNAVSSGLLWPNFSAYWNQVTPGNAGKWGSVEGSQDSYTWAPLDDIYYFAVNNYYPYKHHTLVWGQQQPSWIASLDSATQRAQVEEWIRLVSERYGSTSLVDVVNEPFHAVPSYASALGGSGATGWDWVVTAFRWARQYFFPGVKLILNEYNILHDNSATMNYLRLIDTLRARGLIDAIGIQGHYFEFKGSGYTWPVSTLKYNLERLTATGLPVYISEFDINEPDDSIQLANYKTYFPLFWEEPGVKGITLWGYMQGDMWKVNGYLVRTNGTERPALQWLRRYVSIPFPPLLISPSGTTGEPRNPVLRWHSSLNAKSYHVQVTPNAMYGGNMPVDTTVTDTTFPMNPLDANISYYWHVSALNDSGESAYSSTAHFTTGDQIVAAGESWGRLSEFSLREAYPNPFNPATTIDYTVGQWEGGRVGTVTLVVYDLLGRPAAVLVHEQQRPGRYQVRFNAGELAAGVYFCRMDAGRLVKTIKLVLLR